MNDVKVKREDLIKVLTENREKHRAIFEKAIKGWQKRAIEVIGSLYQQAVDGDLTDASYSLPRPEDHTKDYDTALGMLEMEQRETLVLDQREYRQYVQDEWGWAPQFMATSSAYLGGS